MLLISFYKGDHFYDSMDENETRSSEEMLAISTCYPNLKINRLVKRADKTFELRCNFEKDEEYIES